MRPRRLPLPVILFLSIGNTLQKFSWKPVLTKLGSFLPKLLMKCDSLCTPPLWRTWLDCHRCPILLQIAGFPFLRIAKLRSWSQTSMWHLQQVVRLRYSYWRRLWDTGPPAPPPTHTHTFSKESKSFKGFVHPTSHPIVSSLSATQVVRTYLAAPSNAR